MTSVYTYSQARQKLAAVLAESQREGEVRIKRRDGQEFVVMPAEKHQSALDVRGVDVDISREEIVEVVREIRERGEPCGG